MMWLSRVPGLKRKTIEILLDYFGNTRDIWKATEKILMSIDGIGPVNAEKICAAKDEDQLKGWIYELEEKEIQYISRMNTQYPFLLKQIYSPPLGFYVKGDMPDENIEKVSIVGARKCSDYGKTCAHKIAKDLAKCNIAIVSGMAKGIDTASHKGALDGFGPTIAVLGCGLDVCFPKENRALMDRIAAHGCVISEYPLGTQPYASHFPQRNRIIVGLSKIVVVIEAGIKSGALITADLALDENRDVFVLPGEVTSPFSKGTNELIKNGADVITDANDILNRLGIEYTTEEKKEYIEKTKTKLAPEEKKVYDCIHPQAVSVEEILAASQVSVQNLQYLLMMLELKGWIQKLPGGRYERKNGK